MKCPSESFEWRYAVSNVREYFSFYGFDYYPDEKLFESEILYS